MKNQYLGKTQRHLEMPEEGYLLKGKFKEFVCITSNISELTVDVRKLGKSCFLKKLNLLTIIATE